MLQLLLNVKLNETYALYFESIVQKWGGITPLYINLSAKNEFYTKNTSRHKFLAISQTSKVSMEPPQKNT